jgi:hypothetical protein
MMRRIAILCGVIGVTVATARPGLADTLAHRDGAVARQPAPGWRRRQRAASG